MANEANAPSQPATADAGKGFDPNSITIDGGKFSIGGVEMDFGAISDSPDTMDDYLDERRKDAVGPDQLDKEAKEKADGEEAGEEGEEEQPEAADADEKGRDEKGDAKEGLQVEEKPADSELTLTLKAYGEEYEAKGIEEIKTLAQKGLAFDRRMADLAEKNKAIEPFYAINVKLKDDPAFLDYVRNYGNSEYIVEGPQPKVVTESQVSQMVADQLAFKMEGEKAKWAHDAKYGAADGIPKASEVHSQMVQDSLHWDKWTREWVDSNPKAYNEKFSETFQQMCAERGVVPDAAPKPQPKTVPQGVVDTRAALKSKEVAKESARVEGVKTTRPVPSDDGRRSYNKAVKTARATGDLNDLAAAIALSGSLPI